MLLNKIALARLDIHRPEAQQQAVFMVKWISCCRGLLMEEYRSTLMAERLKTDTVPNQTYSDCQTLQTNSPKCHRGYCSRKTTSRGNTSTANSVSAMHKLMKKTLLDFLKEMFL
jgi:hypothetical protein